MEAQDGSRTAALKRLCIDDVYTTFRLRLVWAGSGWVDA